MALTDEDLRKWLDGKTQQEKTMLQVFDTNKVALRIGAAMLDAFDICQDAIRKLQFRIAERGGGTLTQIDPRPALASGVA